MSIKTTTDRVYNFSAGPAVLPLSVLQQIQSDLVALPGVGSSILEISHRSPDFVEIINDARARLIRLLNIPDSHDVMFLQGGSRLQNAMIPMNLITDPSQTGDYIVTGAWGQKSAAEVKHFGRQNIAFDGGAHGFSRLPQSSELNLTDNAAFVHLTSNETIHGVQFAHYPEVGEVPLVCDASSDFMSRPTDIGKFGLIYACAQKNAGTSGVTIVIIRKDLFERANGRLPSYLEYAGHSKSGSMLNTPPTFAIYVTGLVCKWLEEEIGGLAAMEQINATKSQLLYDAIDSSDGFYTGHAEKASRSTMNVVFKLATTDLDAAFVEEAKANGMTTLKGHRSLGGIRASIYNAMPREGVESLVSFMQDFAKRNA